jgi:hypothetical protein
MHDVTCQLFDKRVTVMDDHQGLGSGIIDVNAVIGRLRAARFDGLGGAHRRSHRFGQDPEGSHRKAA